MSWKKEKKKTFLQQTEQRSGDIWSFKFLKTPKQNKKKGKSRVSKHQSVFTQLQTRYP